MHATIGLWVGFNVFVLLMLALDLGVFHREDHVVGTKEAAWWTVTWVVLAVVFGLGLHQFMGAEASIQYFTGYVIEKSLSVDNIFVFVLIFSFFKVPPIYQHRVLFWGIIGALVMRATLIAVGASLLENFHWIMYVFGGFLLLTGIRMAFHKDEGLHPDENPLVKIFRKIMPVTEDYEGHAFFVRRQGKRFATPLFLVLLVIESSDLIFAVDSIPAIFAVTQEPFIVYTSNVFAILGLRSMYFLLAGVMGLFRYLKPALALILTYVGLKMILVDIYPIPTLVSLGIIVGILVVAIIGSILNPIRDVKTS